MPERDIALRGERLHLSFPQEEVRHHRDRGVVHHACIIAPRGGGSDLQREERILRMHADPERCLAGDVDPYAHIRIEAEIHIHRSALYLRFAGAHVIVVEAECKPEPEVPHGLVPYELPECRPYIE